MVHQLEICGNQPQRREHPNCAKRLECGGLPALFEGASFPKRQQVAAVQTLRWSPGLRLRPESGMVC